MNRGARVTIVARSPDGLRDTVAMAGRRAEAFEIAVGDVTDPAAAGLAVERTEQRFGPVDLLVNNAGIMLIGAVEDVALEDWWHVIEVNLLGPMIWSRAVLPAMRAHHRGRIINISSPGAFTLNPYASAYCASKAALVSSPIAWQLRWRQTA